MKSMIRYLLRFLPRTPTFDLIHSLIFFIHAKRRIPRRNSGLFCDYLFFLKNSDDMADALRQITADKVYAKYFIDQIVGRKVTPETYAVFASIEEILAYKLPERCVLKAAHTAGTVVFIEDAGRELSELERGQLSRALKLDYYKETRQINHKFLRKRILCEELIDTPENIKDYKMFCYKGTLKYVQVDSGRHGVHKQNFYDTQWNVIDVIQNNNPTGEFEPIPNNFPVMREISEKIARHFESVRVDLYLKGDLVYVGEITHCHLEANGSFETMDQERKISEIFFQ